MNTYPPLQGRGFGFRPTPDAYYYGHGTPALAWATFALVVLLVLTVGALLIARFAGGRGRRQLGRKMMMRHGGPPDPLEVLRMRFASGQIGRDEFLQASSDLTAAPQPPG
jgi:uncharacterized membrane protein